MNNSTNYDQLDQRITEHLGYILQCTASCKKYGRVLLASPPDKRYPYVYPRDVASAMQLFRRISGSRKGYSAAAESYDLMETMAHFIKDVQAEQGYWGQRYSLEGEDKGIYKQEDNTAHGISIICNYLLTALRLKKDIKDLENLLNGINEALGWSIKNYYKIELNLFHSTTSIHESAMEQGYTCWVNFAYLYAFNLAQEVAELMDHQKIISRDHLEFIKHFQYSINELFMSGDRYIRRIDPYGNMDMRPDFTLLSPYYFGIINYKAEMEKSIRFIEKQLTDTELGMIMRYLPFYNDFATHIHAGNGPWLQYTAILAQYHYWTGNNKRGDELITRIDKYRNEKGEIPEHLSTCKRFENFMETEWKTSIDYEKEFHKPILLPEVDFDKILEETNNMRSSYDETGQKCTYPDNKTKGGGYIQFATPLMWSHVEYIRALLVKAKDWWKIY
jgi:GH15 family glucan-1,4-alpha-glucosidase